MTDFPLAAIGIIGLGHIGSSLALAIRKNGIASQIIGADTNPDTVRYCQQESIVDSIMPLEAMASRCDLIVIAVPPEAVGAVTQQLKPHLGPETVLTDVASVKLPVLRYLEEKCPEGINFIPSHPIAGGTSAGPKEADGSIFARKLVVLTPPQGIEIDDLSLQRVQLFWQHLDMLAELMPAEVHDLIYGYVSHLPHMIAFAATATLSDAPLAPPEIAPQSLPRFIRLGNSNPNLWTDIALHNQAPVVQALRTYLAMLSHIREELGQGDEPEKGTENKTLAATVLFPRIAASCLIATVSMLERQSGQRLARYSGAGFADVASPAAEDPGSEMELISEHYREVGQLLQQYEQRLEAITVAIEGNQPKQLAGLLSDMHSAHLPLRDRYAAA